VVRVRQEVRVVLGVLFVTGALPLWTAWRANWRTSLGQAVLWAVAAWAAWAGTAGEEARTDAVFPAGRYAALCLTGCAGVAVLGARRPGVAAWNFVVAGLLIVLLRPLWEGQGAFRLREAHVLFLAATLAVPLLNYLPTRLAPAALVLAGGCAAVLASLAGQAAEWLEQGGMGLAALSPWLAWVYARRPPGRSEFDVLWRTYRDRFGFLWGQRMREQFNRAAAPAGWPVVLHWGGLRTRDGRPADLPEAVAMLRAVLKRFGPEGESGPAGSP
jgi:hypothetical protein